MEQLLSDEAYIITGVYLTVVGVLAVCGNTLVLYVLYFGRPSFITIHRVLMYIITISDLLIGAIAYPLTAVSGYAKRWYFDEFTCKASGFFVYFLVMCNINSLCCLAMVRYIIVCRPDLERCIRGKRIIWWITCICTYALFWTGAPLVGWSSYGHEPFQTSCTLNWYGKTISDVTYNSLCIVFCYCVPLAIFVSCYYNVLRTSLLRTRPIDWLSTRPDMDNIIEKMARNSKLRASRHMTWICLSMVASFLVTWTPYAVITLWNLFNTPAPSSVQVFPTMFAKLNCIMNPVLYSAFCHHFREAASRAFTCKNKIFPASSQRDAGNVDITVTMLEENSRLERPKSQRSDITADKQQADAKQPRLTEVKPFKEDGASPTNIATSSRVDSAQKLST